MMFFFFYSLLCAWLFTIYISNNGSYSGMESYRVYDKKKESKGGDMRKKKRIKTEHTTITIYLQTECSIVTYIL